ncbi:uncharacterized protein LOC110974402 [Acanthaster planci]|uniref:Uncharacterized protein LOC110974402 n=1 Tax=Acanthaster planci TaxID=133434 RepID=A0A8B7XNE5_ACAPL|nr:uncharacterized protein LOC110974402 [Acanthaster planci]
MAAWNSVSVLSFVAVVAISQVLAQSATSPSFAVTPSKTDGVIGYSVTIYCTVANLGRHQVFWNVNQRADQNQTGEEFTLGPNTNQHASYPRFQFEGDKASGEFHLQISNVSYSDAGTYICLIRDPLDEGIPVMEAQAELNVGNTPMSPGSLTCSGIPSNAPNQQCAYMKGDLLTLTCTSEGGVPLPELSWVRVNGDDSVTNLKGTTTVSGDIKTTTAKITLSSRDNQAYYKCIEAHPNLTNDRQCFMPSNIVFPRDRMNVCFAPEIDIIPKTITVEALGTKKVTLSCTANANPPLSKTQEIILPVNKSGNYPNGEFDKTLVEVEMTTDDAGKDFYCQATNALSVSTERFEVIQGRIPTWLILIIIGAIAIVLFLFIVLVACICCIDRSNQEEQEGDKKDPSLLVMTPRRSKRKSLRHEGEDEFLDDGMVPIDNFQGGQEMTSDEFKAEGPEEIVNSDFETGETGPRYQNVNEVMQEVHSPPEQTPEDQTLAYYNPEAIIDDEAIRVKMASRCNVTIGLVAVALLTMTGVVSQTIPGTTISVRPSNTVAAQGHTAILYCTISNLGRHQVFWNINQRTDVNTAGKEFTIGPNVNSHDSYPRFQFQGDPSQGEFNLRITNVRAEDAGTYICLVSDPNNPTSAAMEAGAQLTVIDSPQPPVDGYPQCTGAPDGNPVGHYNQGVVLTLTCVTRGGVPPPQLSWERVRDENVTQTLPIRTVGNNDVITATAMVTLSSVDHRSYYRCVETHPSSVAKRSCREPMAASGPQPTLEVSFKPVVRITPSVVNVQFLETVAVELKCQAYANPTLDGRPEIILPENKTGNLILDDDQTKTAVRVELTTDDVGKDFFCRASNRLGVVDAVVEIKRLGELPTWLILVVIGAIAGVLFIFIVVVACICCVDRSGQEDEGRKDRLRYSVNKSRPTSMQRDGDEDEDYIGDFEEEMAPIEDFQGGQESAAVEDSPKEPSTSNDFETGEKGPRYQNVNEAFQSDSYSFSQSNPSSTEPIIDPNSE